MNGIIAAALLGGLMLSACSHAEKKTTSAKSEAAIDGALPGRAAIQRMAGCYLVDYSYVETEGLKPGYKRDGRIYDVNRTKAVKEWIYADEITPRRVRLQHVLFATDANGKLEDGSILKHQAEDWEFEAPYLYEYVGTSQWKVRPLESGSGLWTRRITNLDDGLRYQCAAPWKVADAHPEWSCDGLAPIPGRETRDMKRKDYDTLQRSTRLIVYGENWLERQDNIKAIGAVGKVTPLAKETGKNWYVRLPDQECGVVQAFIKERRPFWTVLRESWDEVLDGKAPVAEKSMKPPRFAKMMEIEKTYLSRELSKPEVRAEARREIMAVIEQYREGVVQ